MVIGLLLSHPVPSALASGVWMLKSDRNISLSYR
jgi:hypothetical protein